MSYVKAAMSGVSLTLLDAVGVAFSTGHSDPVAIPTTMNKHTVSLEGSALAADGTVQIESADTYNYSGTWNPVGGGPVLVVASQVLEINFEGYFKFIRLRMAVAMSAGTVTGKYKGAH